MRTIDADALIRKLENNSPDPEGVDEWISIIEKEPTIDVAIPETKMGEYTGDGYADGKMVYDMANCPNCNYEFEESDFIWGCKFCPECGQALEWEGEEE